MEETKRTRRRTVVEWVETLATALIAVVLLFTFLFRVVTVSGTSMEPTLQGSDVLLVSHLFYTPQQGDIIIVDGYSTYGEQLVKRIVALEGDEVDIDFASGEVYVNGQLLDEPYLAAPTTRQFDVTFPVTVPEGCVFIMGDNRPVSLDSRDTRVGFIDERDILGKALLRILPFNRIGGVS